MLRHVCAGIRRRALIASPAVFRPAPFCSSIQRKYAKSTKEANGRSKSTKAESKKTEDIEGSKIPTSSTETANGPAILASATQNAASAPETTSERAKSTDLDSLKNPNESDNDSAKKSEAPASEEGQDPLSDEYLTTIFESMEPYMDTYSVYTELQKAGFSSSQADEIINLVIAQINTKLSKLSTKYSQLIELENEKYLFESAQQELRVDVTRSREKHINELVNLLHLLERDFNILSDDLNGDFIQMKNDTQVATNDQKSENTLQSKKIILRIQETNHKITTELNSAMRSEIESLRWHISRWGIMAILVSVFSGCAVYYVHKINSSKKQSKHDFVPLVIYEPSEYEEDDYHTDLDKNLVA